MNHRTVRRALLVLPALTAAGLALATMPATAQQLATSASCATLSVPADITPALGPTASPITATGTGGTAACSGTVDGAAIDSSVPAVFNLTASSPSSSCADVGGGTGKFGLDVTDKAGTHHSIAGSFSWKAGNQGAITLTGQLAASGGLRPITGNCTTAPLSRASFDLTNGTVNV
ncbi:hypothetical protein [Amycolatopsis samaneae]|uniref:Secreted protein n=1 Tax=Amycolatopsis samaneae TaxID=664691 RepID=A0ABW5GPB0_9PSEU